MYWIQVGFQIAIGFVLAVIVIFLFFVGVCSLFGGIAAGARKFEKEQVKWGLVVVIAVFVAAIFPEESSNLRRWGIAILLSVILVDGMMDLKQNWKNWKEKRKKKLADQKQSTERLLQ